MNRPANSQSRRVMAARPSRGSNHARAFAASAATRRAPRAAPAACTVPAVVFGSAEIEVAEPEEQRDVRERRGMRDRRPQIRRVDAGGVRLHHGLVRERVRQVEIRRHREHRRPSKCRRARTRSAATRAGTRRTRSARACASRARRTRARTASRLRERAVVAPLQITPDDQRRRREDQRDAPRRERAGVDAEDRQRHVVRLPERLAQRVEIERVHRVVRVDAAAERVAPEQPAEHVRAAGGTASRRRARARARPRYRPRSRRAGACVPRRRSARTDTRGTASTSIAAGGLIRIENASASHAHVSRGTVLSGSSPLRSTHHTATSAKPHDTESTWPQYADT